MYLENISEGTQSSDRIGDGILRMLTGRPLLVGQVKLMFRRIIEGTDSLEFLIVVNGKINSGNDGNGLFSDILLPWQLTQRSLTLTIRADAIGIEDMQTSIIVALPDKRDFLFVFLDIPCLDF